MNNSNRNIRLLPIIGIALTLIGFFYLTYKTNNLNDRKKSLVEDINELESIKAGLTKELKKSDTIIKRQDKIIEKSSDPATVEEGKELKRQLIEPNSVFFTVTEKDDNNIDNAKKFESEGFDFLLSKDVEQAISSFIKSENSYNSYHQVYGIAKYLKKNKNKLTDSNSVFWTEAYQNILIDYSWKMPTSTKKKIQAEIVKE